MRRSSCKGSPDAHPSPNVLAERVTALAAVRHRPLRHAELPLQERHRIGQLMGLAWIQDAGPRASAPVGINARLGAAAATLAAQRFTLISTLAAGALFSASTVSWSARCRCLPGTSARVTPRSWAMSSSRSCTPSCPADQSEPLAVRDRAQPVGVPLAPFSLRQTIAARVRRKSRDGSCPLPARLEPRSRAPSMLRPSASLLLPSGQHNARDHDHFKPKTLRRITPTTLSQSQTFACAFQMLERAVSQGFAVRSGALSARPAGQVYPTAWPLEPCLFQTLSPASPHAAS